MVSGLSWVMGRGINILLIDDCEDDVVFFRLGVENIDANITHVVCFQDAIKHLVTSSPPDLIVMGVLLPGMPVESFLDWLRKSKPEIVQNVPLVIYTGALDVSKC